jgi:hypothetical protein
MKIEKQPGDRTVYSTVINGKTVCATTTSGERGAQRIFEIIRSQNGVAKSAPMPLVLPATQHR